jgi:hypothetical protein
LNAFYHHHKTLLPAASSWQNSAALALHELGHVLTLGHEDGSLTLMATSPKVSDVLYHNEKVGWSASARQRFDPLPAEIFDMGVFPLRKCAGFEVYASLSPTTVSRGANVTISDFSVENLGLFHVSSNPKYRVILENVTSGVATEIGWFAWPSFNPFSEWNGNLTFRVPGNVPPATYRVVAEFTGQDDDRTNDRAVFGTIDVR